MKHIDAIISRCKKHDKVKVRSGAPAVMDGQNWSFKQYADC